MKPTDTAASDNDIRSVASSIVGDLNQQFAASGNTPAPGAGGMVERPVAPPPQQPVAQPESSEADPFVGAAEVGGEEAPVAEQQPQVEGDQEWEVTPHQIPKARFDEVLAREREAREQLDATKAELEKYRQSQLDEQIKSLASLDIPPDDQPDNWHELTREQQLMHAADLISRRRMEGLFSPELRDRIRRLDLQDRIMRDTGLREMKQVDAVRDVLEATPALTSSDALTLARTRNPGLFSDGGTAVAQRRPAMVTQPKGGQRPTQGQSEQSKSAALDQAFLSATSVRGRMGAVQEIVKRG